MVSCVRVGIMFIHESAADLKHWCFECCRTHTHTHLKKGNEVCIYCNIIFNYSHYLYVASFLYLFIFFSCASTALCIASMEFGGGRVDEEQKQKNVLAGIAGKNCRNDRRAVCNSTNVFHISRAFFFSFSRRTSIQLSIVFNGTQSLCVEQEFYWFTIIVTFVHVNLLHID